jgi:phosphoglycolate phosphatase
MSHKIHLETWETRPAEAISLRSPGINSQDFQRLYEPLLAKYIESGKLDTIPKENYETLDQLLALGKTLIVLTSRTHDRMKYLLKKDHSLASRVKTFYYKGNTRFHKSDPRVFDEILQKTGLMRNQCVYVGDSLRDAKTTKKAGLYFIASLESKLRHTKDFKGIPVDIFIKKFPELVSAITHLESSGEV